MSIINKLTGVSLIALASGVHAQSITLENYKATIKVGETITNSKTITCLRAVQPTLMYSS